MVKRLALIDGDTLAFRIASAVQGTIEWPSGWIEPYAVRWEGEAALENYLAKLLRRLGIKDYLVFLSCPSADNWRLQVDPNYKSNRKDSIRPLLLEDLKNYLRLKHGAVHFGHLEADDAIGLHMTDPALCPEPYKGHVPVAVGRDKDFHTIPGLHYQLGDDDLFADKPFIRKVSEEDAKFNHMVQALAGDAVDGYPGCPGIGMTSARRLLEDPQKLRREEGVITRGPNKGKPTVKWVADGPTTLWGAVVAQYKKAGLGVDEAIQTARLANILQVGQYDMETKQVGYWTPTEFHE